MLSPGQRFKLDHKIYRVLHVNASRAHCKCETREQVTVKEVNRKTGEDEERTFTAGGGTINISPNSFVEVLTDDTPEVVEQQPHRAQGGWHVTDTPATLRPGSRMAVLLAYVVEHPGVTSQAAVEALGKGADQIMSDLKRKGLVERR